MHFLDEIMLNLGQFFDPLALVPKLIQKRILFDGKTAHPPKTNAPANRPGQSHPEGEVVSIHPQICESVKFNAPGPDRIGASDWSHPDR